MDDLPVPTVPPTVLIVDGHDDCAMSLAEVLRLNGYTVTVANSGQEALRKTLTAPDFVIMELRLPDCDGLELTKPLRQRATSKLPYFIALTTSSQEVDRQRSRQAGIDLHLVKPTEPNELLAILSNHLTAVR